MHQDLLNSINLDEYSCDLSFDEIQDNFWYICVFENLDGKILRIVTNETLAGSIVTPNCKWCKFYCLRHVLEQAFADLEEDQPTFYHEQCPNCFEWVESDLMCPIDEQSKIAKVCEHDSVCPDCVDNFTEAIDMEETYDSLRRPEI